MTTQHGYLVLADISGYTAYLAGVELDHAHEILSDLLETVLGRLTTLLTFSKLEGDAVFVYAPEASVPRGELLLELMEATYVAFRDRQTSMHYRTTCTCNACRNIPTLDLKFFVHHGDFVLQTVAHVTELVGSDVNLAHRLMKNHISEATGWRAYALFTEAGLSHMGLRPDDLHPQVEAYEHLGEVQTHSLNLHARYHAITESRRIIIAPQDAHEQMAFEFKAPLPVIWEWFNDPRKRGQWMQSEIRPVTRVNGRAVAGARNHCVHGNKEVVVEDLLDTRPFEYYTVAHTPQGQNATLTMTYFFSPATESGTHVRITFRGHFSGLPSFLVRPMTKFIIQRNIKGHWTFEKIDDLIAANQPTRVEAG